MRVRHLTATLACLATILAVASPAVADHMAGIRIVQTSFDPNTLTVDVDITGYADTDYTVSSAPWSTLFLGNRTFYGGSAVPAISWGDGSTTTPFGYGSATGIPYVDSTTVSGLPVFRYRGSFSHTFASEGNYTITANSVNSPGTTASSSFSVVTGNYQTFTYFSSYFSATAIVPFLTNTVQVAAFGAAVNVLEIPTVGMTGLLALALLLAGAATWILRR